MTSYHAGAEWKAFTKKARPIIKAQLPLPCVNGCGRLVYPEQKWHVGHLPGHDRALTHERPSLQTVGPSHQKCNTKAGAQLGNQLKNKKMVRSSRDQARLTDR